MTKTKYEVVKKDNGIYILQFIKETYDKDKGCIYTEGIFTGKRKECLEEKERIENNGSGRTRQRRNTKKN